MEVLVDSITHIFAIVIELASISARVKILFLTCHFSSDSTL
jgi:hypothetical protein